MNWIKRNLCRILAALMGSLGTLFFVYGIVGYLASNDGLRVLLLTFIALPAFPAMLLGFFMWKNNRWAILGLRFYLLIIFSSILLLSYFADIHLLNYKPFAIPFTIYCLLWFILSFFCKLKRKDY